MAETASESQRRLFFALCHDLGYDSEVAKERAKTKLGLGSFKDITSRQLSELIDAMQNKANLVEGVKEKLNHSHRFVCTCGKALVPES